MSKLIESTKERDALVNNGFMYLFDALSSDGKRRFWRCRNKSECKYFELNNKIKFCVILVEI